MEYLEINNEVTGGRKGHVPKQNEGHYRVRPPADGELVELPDRPLTASTDSEQAVLGGLLLDNTAWDRITDLVTAADFYRADHRLIFEHIVALIASGQPADALTVCESLERAGKIEQAGQRSYIGALAANIPSAANIRRYGEIVRERAQRRAIAAIGVELQERAVAPGADVEALKREAEARLTGLDPDSGVGAWPAPLDLEQLATSEPQPPRFIVPDWLPCGYPTLFAGHGGVGKSAIAKHLSVAIVIGGKFAGIVCEPRRVLYVACEDRVGVLHWRLARIARHFGISLSELAGRLEILELVGRDATLWERDPRTGTSLTPAYARLAERMRRSRAEVLVIDSLSDVYSGNENARGEVKRFVNSLVALIPADTGAVLLIGHVAKPTAANGATSEGYSGSTGWHNAARARWYLYPERQDSVEAALDDRPERTGALVMELQKSNLGPVDQTIRWRWDDEAHMFLPEPAPSHFDRANQVREERRGILLTLRACAAQGIIVPAAMQGPRTAYHVLATRPELPASLKTRPGKRRFWRLIEEARHIRHIEVAEYRRANRHNGEQFLLTSEGMRQCAV